MNTKHTPDFLPSFAHILCVERGVTCKSYANLNKTFQRHKYLSHFKLSFIAVCFCYHVWSFPTHISHVGFYVLLLAVNDVSLILFLHEAVCFVFSLSPRDFQGITQYFLKKIYSRTIRYTVYKYHDVDIHLPKLKFSMKFMQQQQQQQQRYIIWRIQYIWGNECLIKLRDEI